MDQGGTDNGQNGHAGKLSTSSSAPHREKRILGTSLKMYFDLPGTLRYIDAVASLSSTAAKSHIDLFVIPDFISILPSAEKLRPTSVLLGAQDVFYEDVGAYTGEVSPRTLSQAGVRIVEIGHAERRRLFGETDDLVARKAEAIVRNGMVPLICIGEKTRPKTSSVSQTVGMAVSECTAQVSTPLSAIPDEADVIFAYEPVWAIGAEKPAEADHVVAVVQSLRAQVKARKGRTRFLYGGSAGPGTFEKLKEGVDGLFLGRFAHDVVNLEKVIQEMSEST